MQASEVTDFYYPPPANPNLNTTHLMQNSQIMQFNVNEPTNPFYQIHMNPQYQEIHLQSTYLHSTSDEADEQQMSIINERKQRRMISNRESARRSRMRKQKHLDELWSQVVWLRNENHQLVEKLNKFSETHDQVLQENAQLKEEASELRQMVTELQLNDGNSYPNLRELDDIYTHSNPSVTSSSDFF
ncbi:basic leucine zipper 43-like [Rutidosis leptorrhynchoides]|uniref:basic leucine zipper 43-like n=1 Tax=Rutidosis leptorrhynchoides TaxID=125765 RepID=UPI003A98D2A9